MAGPDAKSDLLWVIGMVALLAIAWFVTGGPGRPAASGGPFIRPPEGTSLGDTYLPAGEAGGDLGNGSLRTNTADDPDQFTATAVKSPYYGQVRLGKGTAQSADKPNDEYVTIENRSKGAVTVSGWSLKNGDDERTHLTWAGNYINVKARWVVIPTGQVVLNPALPTNLAPITLAPGEQAVVTTGRIIRSRPIAIDSSFKTNICTGYLADLPGYEFEPSLPRECPAPRDEPGINSLPEDCYDYVRGLSRCHAPEFDENADGEDTVDGRVMKLRSVCEDYIEEHFSYEGCLKYHSGDANFLGDEWRVFLRTGELWRESRESITLYDNTGRLVDRITY
jgi:hypothetical protein